MFKKKYHRNVYQIVLFLMLIFVLSGCGWLYQSHNGSASSSSSPDISKAGIVVPPFTFINQSNEPFGTEQLTGKYWISNMIFTKCPSVCGIMTPNMRNLQNALIDENLDVTLVSFTVDPDFDSPDILYSYGENNGADFSKWTFLTGYSREEITEFAAEAFQSLVMETDGPDIIHGTSFFLVDDEGNVIRRYDGLSADLSPIITDLKKLTK